MKTRKNFPQVGYLAASRGEHFDEYFGIKVPDPYRWLETEQAPDALAWIRSQDQMTQDLIKSLPEYRRATEWLAANWINSPSSVPIRRKERVFWKARPENAEHDVIYVRDARGERVIFDLNQKTELGARLLEGGGPSPAGRYYVYGISSGGADTSTLQIHDVTSGRDLPEVLPPSLFTPQSWLPDESGFFYSYLPWDALSGKPTDRPPGLYLHKLATPANEDVLVAPHSVAQLQVMLGTASEKLGVLLVQKLSLMGQRGGWGVLPLLGPFGGQTQIEWLMAPDIAHHFTYLGCTDKEVLWVTDYEAPNWRVVALDIGARGLDRLRTVVAEGQEPISMWAGSNAGSVTLHDDRLYVNYIHHNENRVRIFDLQGHEQGQIPLPPLTTMSSLNFTEGEDVGYVGVESFFNPTAVYRFEISSGKLLEDRVVRHTNHPEYQAERVFFTSTDGTRCPMTLMSKRGYKPNGDTPVLLYGYGGWGVPMLPRYSAEAVLWMEMGGIYAHANLRGGMEYGEAWHQAGQFFHKQRVFDDFCAAARYLVQSGHTQHSRIAIVGGSNGGLLTTACYNQHPELFGAVVSSVAAVDLMRLWKTPVGASQTMELGSPAQSKEMAEYLLSYSPVQNVRHSGPYPPILNVVGESDPRCAPGHVYKYVAELQSHDDPERLALLRVMWGAGHGGNDRRTRIEWVAEAVAWAWHMTS